MVRGNRIPEEEKGDNMNNIFELITFTGKDEESRPRASIGISIKIGVNDTIHRISRVCDSLNALESEVRALNKGLEGVLESAKIIFKESSSLGVPEIRPEMRPEEIWEVLSSISDEKGFIEAFNSLDGGKRREVAEYILTRCNMFSGKGAVFSSRYDNESGLME
jgi:hypothetical protein